MERERESAEGGLLASGSGMEIAPLSDWITSDGREGGDVVVNLAVKCGSC